MPTRSPCSRAKATGSTPDLQVAGVEAPLDVGVLQRQGDIGRGLDDRPDVRVEDLGQAVGRANRVDLAQALADDRHPGRVERHGRRPVIVLDQRGDEPGRPAAWKSSATSVRGAGLRPLGRVVQTSGTKPPIIAKPYPASSAFRSPACPGGSRGTEFGGGNSQLAHFAEHPVGRHDLAQPGTSQMPQEMGAAATRPSRAPSEGGTSTNLRIRVARVGGDAVTAYGNRPYLFYQRYVRTFALT